VQRLPSLQVIAAFTQPVAGLQESAVQALLSLHVAEISACTQPVAESQESDVQALPSLQFKADPGTQTPPEQVSFTVQTLLSLQIIGIWVQPFAVS